MALRGALTAALLALCAALLVRPLLSWVHEEMPRSRNLDRHCARGQSAYAHFSLIDSDPDDAYATAYHYPWSLLASPQHFVLTSNTCLYIPERWWHWVRSGPGTVCAAVSTP